MAHSVKNRKKKEKKMRKLRRRVARLSKLASRQIEEVDEMTLPYVALGDLRRRWRQRDTSLHSALLNKFDKFKRIKIEKDKPLRILESDGGLLVYGVALNEEGLVDSL